MLCQKISTNFSWFYLISLFIFINTFLKIVSLGAGYDTLFFSLANQGLLKETKYFEVRIVFFF